MSITDLFAAFDKGGYTLLVLIFVLYFGWKYVTIQLDALEVKLRTDLKIKRYNVEGKITKDNNGEMTIIGHFIEVRDIEK